MATPIGEEVLQSLPLPEFSKGLFLEVGHFFYFLEGIGIILLIWWGMQIFSFFMNRKKLKTIQLVLSNVLKLEKKINSLERKINLLNLKK